MNPFQYARDCNIERYQKLLDTSVEAIERQTLQGLLAEEKGNSKLQTSGANRLRSGKEERPGRVGQTSLVETLLAAIRGMFRRPASPASPPAYSAAQPTAVERQGS